MKKQPADEGEMRSEEREMKLQTSLLERIDVTTPVMAMSEATEERKMEKNLFTA